MKKFITVILSACCAMAMAIQMPLQASAASYQHVTRSTSYAHPDTGEIVDGGSKSNEELGNSMCASIVDDHVLIEKQGGRTFVTMGLGLMSNISNVRFYAVMDGQTSPEQFKPLSASLVGSCQRDGDTCNHYRFELPAGTKYISPIFFVAPMGRDVQFFVQLHMGSIQPGRGDFDHVQAQPSKPKPSKPAKPSKPVKPAGPIKPAKPTVQKAEAVKGDKEDKEEVKKDDKKETAKKDQADKKKETAKDDKNKAEDKDKTDTSVKETEKENTEVKEEKESSSVMPIVIGVAVLAVAAAGGFVYFKKRKG